MAVHEITTAFLRRFALSPYVARQSLACHGRRYATEPPPSPAQDEQPPELESTSEFMEQSPSWDVNTAQGGKLREKLQSFDPAQRSKMRNRQLPRSRYQIRPPRYYRGPLHPIQPPKPSDPSSRAFTAGPFSLPRLEQTYHDSLASDYMTMTYTHFPPGYEHHQKQDRLRPWVGESPYFKNRPLRGPRGYAVLPLLRRPITFRNVPQIMGITVHTMTKAVIESGSAPLHVAGMVLQNITNVRVTPHRTRKSSASFQVRKNQTLSVTCDLRGEDAYHFLSKLIDVVLPKIKDYQGVKGSSGDGSGNIAFGLTGEQVALFPEIEINYDAYPAKLIPGCHIIVKTSSPTDEGARLLLMQMGLPFYGRTKRGAYVEQGQWTPNQPPSRYVALAQGQESPGIR